jgi:hypothetical protein
MNPAKASTACSGDILFIIVSSVVISEPHVYVAGLFELCEKGVVILPTEQAAANNIRPFIAVAKRELRA